MKKYQLLENDFIIYKSAKLYRIKSLIDFSTIKAGELGGYIESENNLSHEGNCWVNDDAKVYQNARVYENAKITHHAKLCGNSQAYGNARVYGYASIRDNAHIHGNARVTGDTLIFHNADVSGDITVRGNTWIGKDAILTKTGDYIKLDGFDTFICPVVFFKTKDGIGCIDIKQEYESIDEYLPESEEHINVINLIVRHFNR